jgi:hypothetical protein
MGASSRRWHRGWINVVRLVADELMHAGIGVYGGATL